jgi:hypothetical protein
MSEVVLGVYPSVGAAARGWQRRLPVATRLPVTTEALYQKLRHVELPVAAALVRESSRRIVPVLHALGATLPPWLEGYHTKILDGNHLEATQHRLTELRTTWAAPLPGKVLVILDQPTLTVTDILLTDNGHAQERSLLPDVLPLVERGDLWIGDRNFCTLGFLFGVAAAGAGFLIRQHGNVVGELLGERRACGRGETGDVYEQWLRLRNAEGKLLIVRRITVVLDRPTKDGDTEIHLLTNVPPKKATAVRLAALYRQRWTIERFFLEVATTLECEIDTLCYPRAALFAFCLGLLASNAVALLKGALRAGHADQKATEAVAAPVDPAAAPAAAEAVPSKGKAAKAKVTPATIGPEEVSGYYVAEEIRRAYDGMLVSIPAPYWVVFREMSDVALADVLRGIARQVSLWQYRKSHRGPKKKPPPRTQYKNGGHVATSKLLAGRKSHK